MSDKIKNMFDIDPEKEIDKARRIAKLEKDTLIKTLELKKKASAGNPISLSDNTIKKLTELLKDNPVAKEILNKSTKAGIAAATIGKMLSVPAQAADFALTSSEMGDAELKKEDIPHTLNQEQRDIAQKVRDMEVQKNKEDPYRHQLDKKEFDVEEAKKNNKEMAKGGVVPGKEDQYAGDTVPALLNKREVVLNVEQQQRNLDHLTGRRFPFPKERVDELLNQGKMSINQEAQTQLFNYIRGETKELPKEDILVFHKADAGPVSGKENLQAWSNNINAMREQNKAINDRMAALKNEEISNFPYPTENVTIPLSAQSPNPVSDPNINPNTLLPSPSDMPIPGAFLKTAETAPKDVDININTKPITREESPTIMSPPQEAISEIKNKIVTSKVQDSINKQTLLKSNADLKKADEANIQASIDLGNKAKELYAQQVEQAAQDKAINDKWNQLQDKYDTLLRSDYQVEGEQSKNPFENKSALGRYFSSANVGESILMGLALAISVPFSLVTGKNPALDFILNSVDKDLEAQKLDEQEKMAKKTHMLNALKGQVDLLQTRAQTEDSKIRAAKLAQEISQAAEKNKIDWFNAQSQRISAMAANQKANIDTLEYKLKERKMQDPSFMDKDKTDQSNKLREEYNQLIQKKGYDKIQTALALAEKVAKDPSAAGDIAMLYSLVKTLDPESAVREGEIELAREGMGAMRKVKQFIDNKMTGKLFDPSYRYEILDNMRLMAQVATEAKNNLRSSYVNLAQDYGINPKFVIRDAESKAPQTSKQTRDANIQKLMNAGLNEKAAEAALTRYENKKK